MLDADGERYQRLWRCPRVSAPSEDPLHPSCARALANVHRLVGSDEAPPEFTTCPGHYVRKPEAHQLAAALGWYKKGQLHLRAPNPSGALVDAIDCVENALSQREADEIRRLRAREDGKPQQGRNG